MAKNPFSHKAEKPGDTLAAGLILLVLWVLALAIPSRVVFRFLGLAAESQDSGLLLAAAGILVLINTARAVPLYLGWFMAGEAFALFFPKRGRGLSWLVPLAAIPSSYFLLHRLSGSVTIHFGTPAILGILTILALHALTREVPGWGNRALALALLIFSFQWLDIVPLLTPYGFGWGEVSRAVKEMAGLLGEGATWILNGAGIVLFFSVFAGGLVTAELLVNLGLRLRHALRLREQERQISALREEALDLRSLRELQQLVHDLKRPLTAVTGLTDVLSADPGLASAAPHLEQIALAASTMNTMISEILYANVRRRISAGEVLEYTLSQLSALPWKDNVVVARTYQGSGPAIRVNLVRLSRALMNLLDNANRATTGLDSPRILFEVRAGARAVEFEISDNGPGFGSSSPGGKSGWESTGIGLAFVREVSETHAGTLAFRDRDEGGASVSLALPLDETAEKSEDLP